MKTTYYVAATVDGYIANCDGSVDFLDDIGEPDPSAFAAFLNSVDALVMGRRTYDQILSFGDWPYGDRRCTVMTRRALEPICATVSTTSRHVSKIHASMIEAGVNHLWVVGGADIATQFLDARLLDRIIVSTVPIVLGGGIPLFTSFSLPHRLTLVESVLRANGILENTYHTQD